MSTHSRAVKGKKTYIIIITAAGLTRERGLKKKKGSAHSFCLFFKFAKKKKKQHRPNVAGMVEKKMFVFQVCYGKENINRKLPGKKRKQKQKIAKAQQG